MSTTCNLEMAGPVPVFGEVALAVSSRGKYKEGTNRWDAGGSLTSHFPPEQEESLLVDYKMTCRSRVGLPIVGAQRARPGQLSGSLGRDTSGRGP